MGNPTAAHAGSALALLALVAALALKWGEARADELFSAEGGVFHDNNLSRALSAADIVGDTALNAAASAGFLFAPGDRDIMTLTGDLRGTAFSRFHGMSSAALGATASWTRKFGLGAFAPWARISAYAADVWYDENVRNGWRTGVALRGGERVSERLDLSAGGSFERYRADSATAVVPGISGDAFTVLGRNLFARADYALAERWTGFGAVAGRWGDVTASTRIGPEIFEYSNAIAADPAFGSDYFAYRISGATTWEFLAGASYALGDRSSVNLAVSRALTYASGGIEYQSTRVNASLVFSY
ncbi:MAG TPA: hypothetical protein VMI74_16950 [Burkholderiales bacterium]|nr:hypothetical protein [Burkholderiales bacterium]